MTPPKWPYTTALVSALLGCLGFAVAPFSGIAYPLALPGLLVAAWWVVAHAAPHRAEIAIAAALLLGGLAAGLAALYVPALGIMRTGNEGLAWTVLALPVPVLLLAGGGALAGLGRLTAGRRAAANAG